MSKFKAVFKAILPRLKEPSTYAGLGVLAMAFFGWSGEQWGSIVGLLVAGAGVAAAFLKETPK